MLVKEEERDGGIKEEEDSGDWDFYRNLRTATSKLHDESVFLSLSFLTGYELGLASTQLYVESTHLRKLHQLSSKLLFSTKTHQHCALLLWLLKVGVATGEGNRGNLGECRCQQPTSVPSY